ncbi:hypothetical protein C8A05DRAFT_38548 [Staphylotrichum tortipilum]|uniref:CorA-like transporter domain-containing protein n=1 Tax=Staphylotrichum tortipilum TaxID=2831512 RepID=A0AAN6RPP2_9PEZI|nr:hypothetical protein C8A05DRAFT_38548 [Staphylotrichum longicolle]
MAFTTAFATTAASRAAPMPQIDPQDRLNRQCKRASQYPYTLLTNTISRVLLTQYDAALTRDEADLFDGSKSRLVFWDAWPGTQVFEPSTIDNAEKLSEHLLQDRPEPKCRHVFLESDHSRAPLNCTLDMLKLLLTYHQVNPSFLDALFAFGDQEKPLDASLALIRSEDTLEPLYHHDHGGPINVTLHEGAMRHDVGPAFEASLATHIIYFRWCEQNWRWFIRDMEDRVRNALLVARTIPIDTEPHFTLRRRDAGSEMSEPSPADDARPSGFAGVSEKQSILASIPGLRRLHMATPRPARDSEVEAFPALPSRPIWGPDLTLVLNMFSFRDLQKLTTMARRLEEASLVIQLNMGVLRDASDYYQHAVKFDDIKSPELRSEMVKSADGFSRRVHQLIRSLETSHTQAVSLGKMLESGTRLYEQILQMRNLQVGRTYAEHEHRASINMERIARRTERDTVTMHTITIVTLVFLPATFLCTFFQSGVFQWADMQEISGDWLFRTDVFRLFMAICIPMTVLTLCGWAAVNTLARTRARK